MVTNILDEIKHKKTASFDLFSQINMFKDGNLHYRNISLIMGPMYLSRYCMVTLVTYSPIV